VNRLLLASLTLLCAALALPLVGGADKPKGKKAPAKEFANSIGMKLVLIPAGKFTMGSPKDEKGREMSAGGASGKETQHEVEITRPFYIGVYPVTQAQYKKVMGTNPSWFSAKGTGSDKVEGLNTDSFPVERVSWQDAKKFCAALSKLPAEKKAGRTYRLPTEAEWEYACRAGTTTPFNCGKSLSSRQANFDGKYPYGGAPKGPYLGRTCKVGSYKPNAWGLYDMHGNVYHFCSDWFKKDNVTGSPKKDPKGPKKGDACVLRGGSWINSGWACRAAFRMGVEPDLPSYNFGFRVVRDIPRKP
jgi:formylglycine-generating enzyme required for sulfatase activity